MSVREQLRLFSSRHPVPFAAMSGVLGTLLVIAILGFRRGLGAVAGSGVTFGLLVFVVAGWFATIQSKAAREPASRLARLERFSESHPWGHASVLALIVFPIVLAADLVRAGDLLQAVIVGLVAGLLVFLVRGALNSVRRRQRKPR